MMNASSGPRVVLVYPKTGWDLKNVTSLLPLSILYLVRPLRRAGFDVELIDQRLDSDWENRLLSFALDDRTLAVGISAMTGLQIRWGIKAARIVRKNSRLPIVWGGIHPTLLPEQTLQSGWADYVVRGEGELTLPELMQAVADSASVDDIAGICYLKGDDIYATAERPFIELDQYLIPDYDAVNVSDYITTQTLGIKDLAITTSRGCPNRCSYCYNLPYSKRRWRAQSAEGVVEHIRLIQKRFNIQGILIKDDNFFVDRKRIEKIAQGLEALEKPVIIRGECRADYIARHWDEDFLEYLFQHGFREMTVGAESGSDETLELLCKDISVNDIRVANERLGRAGIATKFTFMTGYPNEKIEHIRQTLDLMLELVKENPHARVTPLHLFAPYPGTSLYEKSIAGGYTPPGSLEEWAGVNFHELRLPWISQSLSKKLENASVATYFLDGRTVPEYFAGSALMRFAAKVYGAVVRWRAARFFFHWMPEILVFEWVRKRKKLTDDN